MHGGKIKYVVHLDLQLIICSVGANTGQIYFEADGDSWPIDDLIMRERPTAPPKSLSSVLEAFANKESGQGLVEVGVNV